MTRDRADTHTERVFGAIKPDGRRFTLGVHSNGGKHLVVRARRDVPEIDVIRGAGYVLIGTMTLPSRGEITLARGNARDISTHFVAPAKAFSEDWRSSPHAAVRTLPPPPPGQRQFRRPTAPSPAPLPRHFVDPARISELRDITVNQFDLRRLLRMCEELNACFTGGHFLSVAMLTRAILDHIHPVFGAASFGELANNTPGGQVI